MEHLASEDLWTFPRSEGGLKGLPDPPSGSTYQWERIKAGSTVERGDYSLAEWDPKDIGWKECSIPGVTVGTRATAIWIRKKNLEEATTKQAA